MSAMTGSQFVPPSEESEDSPLVGSVKPYQRHLAVCTGGPRELWAARVEEMDGLFRSLHGELVERGLSKQVKLTACDEPSTGFEGFDIFLLPDMLVLHEVTVDKVGPLVEALRTGTSLPVEATPMPEGDHLFVCVHANRDARCGAWGPLFYEALSGEVARQGLPAHVHRTSHIGGHRFAAVCIVYPEGVWYGNLRPEDAPRLVEQQLRHGRLLVDKYRGRLGVSPCYQVAEAVAAGALAKTHPDYRDLRVEVDEHGPTAEARAWATVIRQNREVRVRTSFRLSCPTVWWTADEEPVFGGEL